MLGIWGRSCLRSQLSNVVVSHRTLHFTSLKHHHTLPTTVLGLRNPTCMSEGKVSPALTIVKSWPTRRFNSTQAPPPTSPSPNVPSKQKPSLLSRFLSAKISSNAPESASSFRKIVALARPEWKPLTIAIGLLLLSSAVSMSVPFTIGKLIDFFSTTNPVSILCLWSLTRTHPDSSANTLGTFGLASFGRPPHLFHSRGSGKRWSCYAYEAFGLV